MKSFNYLILGIASLFLLSCEKTLNKEELRFVHNTLVERMVQEKFCEELPEKISLYMDEPFTNWAESRVVHVQHDAWDDLFSGNSLWAEIKNNEARKVNAQNNRLKEYTADVVNHIEEIITFLRKQAETDIYGTIDGIKYLDEMFGMYDYCQSNYTEFNVKDSLKTYYKESYEPILSHFWELQEMSQWTSDILWGTTGKGDINYIYDEAFNYYCNNRSKPGMNFEYKIIDALVITYIANYLNYGFQYAKVSEKDGRILEYIAPKIDYIYHAYGSIDGNGNTIENENVWAIGYDNQQAFMVTLINNEDNMRMVYEPIEYDVTLVGEGLDMIN